MSGLTSPRLPTVAETIVNVKGTSGCTIECKFSMDKGQPNFANKAIHVRSCQCRLNPDEEQDFANEQMLCTHLYMIWRLHLCGLTQMLYTLAYSKLGMPVKRKGFELEWDEEEKVWKKRTKEENVWKKRTKDESGKNER